MQPDISALARAHGNPVTGVLSDARADSTPQEPVSGAYDTRRVSYCLGGGRRADRPVQRPLQHGPILAAIDAQLSTAAGDEARRVAGSSVGRAAVLAIAAVDLAAADRDTLENVATSHATAAAAASGVAGRARPWGAKVAQRARMVLAALGWQQQRVRGRRLTLAECAEARAVHGRTQTMAASTRDWIVPEHLRLESIVHQPVTHLSTSPTSHNPRQRAQARAAAERKSNRRPTSTRPPQRRACSINVQRFAARLVTPDRTPGRRSLPILDCGHVGNVVRIVEAIGVDVDRWTVDDLFAAIDHAADELGWHVDVGAARNPVGYFVRVARFAVDLAERSGWTLPSERIRASVQERADRHARQERERLEAVAERRRLLDDEATNAAAAAFFEGVRRDAGARRSKTARHAQFVRRATTVDRAEAVAELAALRARLDDQAAAAAPGALDMPSTPDAERAAAGLRPSASLDSSLSCAPRANR